MTCKTIPARSLAATSPTATLDRSIARRADRADKAQIDLLTRVVHDLGSPLTVVKGNVAAIRRFLEQQHIWSEELSQREDDVEVAVEWMLALREELLASSRSEQRELELVPLHLLHRLHRVVRWAQTSASEKGIQLTEEDSAKVPYVIGDGNAVQSIFTNLLSNAVRYTPEGGAISVKTSNEGARLTVEIADTGIGISEQDQQRIFERFYRTSAAQQVESSGRGLGLAISRDLVSALGGTIEVRSLSGAGSTFKVTFPMANIADEEV
ncbi:MAG: HAMP domain-containing sensor histidine kinase [Tepidiformaceae bacterium]